MPVLDWSEVAADPKFQALAPEARAQVRDDYFAQVKAPAIETDALDAQQAAFRGATERDVQGPGLLERAGTAVTGAVGYAMRPFAGAPPAAPAPPTNQAPAPDYGNPAGDVSSTTVSPDAAVPPSESLGSNIARVGLNALGSGASRVEQGLGAVNTVVPGGLAMIADQVHSWISGKPETGMQDKVFGASDQFKNAQETFAPDASDVHGVAEKVLNGLATAAPDLAVAIGTGGASEAPAAITGAWTAAREIIAHGMKSMAWPSFVTGVAHAKQLIEQGTPVAQAAIQGMTQGLATDLTSGLPMAAGGSGLAMRAAQGAVLGLAGSQVQRSIENAATPGPAAPQDPDDAIVSAATGALFGAVGGHRTAPPSDLRAPDDFNPYGKYPYTAPAANGEPSAAQLILRDRWGVNPAGGVTQRAADATAAAIPTDAESLLAGRGMLPPTPEEAAAQAEAAAPPAPPAPTAVWHSGDTDFPVTPTGEVHVGPDGRKYAAVISGGVHTFVPADELSTPKPEFMPTAPQRSGWRQFVRPLGETPTPGEPMPLPEIYSAPGAATVQDQGQPYLQTGGKTTALTNPADEAPTGVIRVNSAGTAVPETGAQARLTQAATNVSLADAARRTELGLTPDVQAAGDVRAAGDAAAENAKIRAQALAPTKPRGGPKLSLGDQGAGGDNATHETFTETNDLSAVRSAQAGWESVLPGLPRGLYARLAEIASPDAAPTTEGSRQELRQRLLAQGQTPAQAVRGLLKPGFADASRRLQQAAGGDVALPSVPRGGTPARVDPAGNGSGQEGRRRGDLQPDDASVATVVGRPPPERQAAGPIPSYGEPTPGSISAYAVHYSPEPRPVLDGAKYGTGARGAEGARLEDGGPDLARRSYFYVDEGAGVKPESGVGGVAHDVLLRNLYDPRTHALGRPADDNEFEQSVVDAGYDGYYAPGAYGKQGGVVLLNQPPLSVRPRVAPTGRTVKIALLSKEIEAVQSNLDALHRAAPSARLKNGNLEVSDRDETAARLVLNRIAPDMKPVLSNAPSDAYFKTQAAGTYLRAADTGRVLLQRRGKGSDQAGKWAPFGGGIEEGENPEQAARRELQEETGYEGPMTVHGVMGVHEEPGVLRYTTHAGEVPHEFEPKIDNESMDAGWFHPRELPSNLHPGFEDLLRRNPSREPVGVQDENRPGDLQPGGSPGNAAEAPGAGGAELAESLRTGAGPALETPLAGLPTHVVVGGRTTAFGPHPAARVAAARYMQDAGLPYEPPTSYVRIDPERGARIATAFDAMEHAPGDPAVRAAYEAMVHETLAQYQAIKATGLTVEFQHGADPYGNPRNMILDVVDNNHMSVFPTLEDFGGDATAHIDTSDNPLLADSGERFGTEPATVNDVFRVVHDYFGHVKEGVGFRAEGEENAWQSHAAMYSDAARPAMTSETRGQNSYVNYGPYAEANRTASPADTEYAPQKTGLMPDWTATEGRQALDVDNQTPQTPDDGKQLTEQDSSAPVDEATGLAPGAQPGADAANSADSDAAVAAVGKSLADRVPGYLLDPGASPDGARAHGVEALAAALGRRVQWVKQPGIQLFNGLYDSRYPDTIFIDQGTTRPAAAVFGHELLHSISESDPEAYGKLLDALVPLLKNEGARYAEINKARAAKGLAPLGDDEQLEEMAADIVGDRFTEPEFWQGLADRQADPKPFLQRILDAVKSMIRTIAQVRPFGTERYLTDLRAARRAVGDLLEAHLARDKQTETPEFKQWFDKATPVNDIFERTDGQSSEILEEGEPDLPWFEKIVVADTLPRYGIADQEKEAQFKESSASDMASITKTTPPILFIKPDGSVELLDGGHRIRAAQREGGEISVLFARKPSGRAAASPAEPQAPFYSELQRAIDGTRQGRATPGQWISTIKALPRVKPQEVAWTGLEDWLRMRDPKQPVTRQEIGEYLKANGVRVEETVLGEPDEAAPKFGGYRVAPGGSNYREMLLHLPKTEGRPEPATLELLRQRSEQRGLTDDELSEYHRLRRIEQGQRPLTDFSSSHWEQPNVLAHIRFDERTDADGKRVLLVHEIQSDWGQAGKRIGFQKELIKQSTEWKQVDDTHYRFTTEAEANEFAGRQQLTYDPEVEYRHVAKQMEDGRWGVVEEARSKVGVAPARSGVPDAPFIRNTADWTALAIKRIAKYAADRGFDRVAFPTGDQVANMFDLSKHVDRIDHSDNGDGTYSMSAIKDGKELASHENQTPEQLERLVGKDITKKIVAREGTPASESGHVDRWEPEDGYDMTDIRSLSGLDLKVGGDGMRGYYDKIVPSVAKDVVRKLGGDGLKDVALGSDADTRSIKFEWSPYGDKTVQLVDQDGKSYNAEAKSWDTDEGSIMTLADAKALRAELLASKPIMQPGFDITPRMREAAAGGVPLFSLADGHPLSWRDATDRLEDAGYRVERDQWGQAHALDASGAEVDYRSMPHPLREAMGALAMDDSGPGAPDFGTERALAKAAPSSMRFSLDEAAAKAESPVAKGNLRDRIQTRIDHLFDPLSRIPDEPAFSRLRYETMGRMTKIEGVTGDVVRALRAAKGEDIKALYPFFTEADADPKSISDPSLRDAAVRSKKLLGTIADSLVERGMLDPDSRDDYRDRYLPRVYLKHLLEKRSGPLFGGGKTASDMGYTRARLSEDKLPEEVRRTVLGEVKDVPFLAALAIGRPMRDMAVLDYLSAISKHADWVMPNQTVEFEGRNATPQWLHAEGQSLRARAAHMPADDAAKAVARAEAMEKAAAEGTAAQARGGPQNAADYRQVPDSARFGQLRGMWVHREIHNDLVGAMKMRPEDMSIPEKLFGTGSWGSQIQRAFKFSKVTMSPPSHDRLFLANLVQLHLRGMPLAMIPYRVAEALNDVRTKGAGYQVAERYGATHTTMQSVELPEARADMLKLLKESNMTVSPLQKMTLMAHWLAGTALGAGYAGMSEAAVGAAMGLAMGGSHGAAIGGVLGGGLGAIMGGAAGIKKVGAAMGRAFQTMEVICKVAMVNHQLANGAQPYEAAQAAHDALYDYSRVPETMRYLRNSPFGAPFASWQFKTSQLLANTLLQRPQRFLPWIALYYGLPYMMAQLNGASVQDTDKMRKVMPEFMREAGSMAVLPGRDPDGNLQFSNIGGYLPWGSYSDTLQGLESDGTPGEKALHAAAPLASMFLSGPIVDAMTVLKTGVDPFTKKPILQEGDPASEKLWASLNYAYNEMAPSFITSAGVMSPFWAHDPTMGGRVAQVVTGATDKFGTAKATAAQTAARLVGASTYSVNPDQSKDGQVQQMEQDIMAAKQRMIQRLTQLPRTAPEDQRAAIVGEYRDEVNKRMAKLQEFEAREVPASTKPAK